MKGLRPGPPRWTPYSSALGRFFRFGQFSPKHRSASDADNAQPTGRENEKRIVRRHQYSLLNIHRGEGFRSLGCKAFRCFNAKHDQSEKGKGSGIRLDFPNLISPFLPEAAPAHDSTPISNRTHKHPVSKRFWMRVRGHCLIIFRSL